jgi:hypothetical protein
MARIAYFPRRLLPFAAAVTIALWMAPIASAVSDSTQFSVVAGSLSFATSPHVPTLPTLTLNGQAQTLNTTMNNFSVDDSTGSGSGWNVTVNGDASGGHSAVFAQYCTAAGCGGVGYVASGLTLAADSLTLNSTSASFTGLNGTTGTAPTYQCGSGCSVDNASAVKIVSAATGAGMGTWQTSGFTGTSLALSAPSTIQALPANEVYHLDLIWSLNSGP